MKRFLGITIIGIVLVVFLIFTAPKIFFAPTPSTSEQASLNTTSIVTVADHLNIPWEIAFLPNNDMLVTERSGNLLRIEQDKKTIISVAGVQHRGEGGLLGMVLHPRFAENHWIYLYFTSTADGVVENRVERFVFSLEQNQLTDKKIIVDHIPGANYHDGGRIAFSPDGFLYIATGDAGVEQNAQNIQSLAGKILRVSDDGNIPQDNPFGNAVYSYGHRNIQGLTWDDRGRLWVTEHGRSGVLSGYDELNLIVKGKNYGWPVIQGDEQKENMERPVIHSGPSETWAPAGAAHVNGKIFFTGLRGASLYVYTIDEKILTVYLRNTYGRLRAIVLHDGALYISTSNRDGRGSPRDTDDQILKIPLTVFSP